MEKQKSFLILKKCLIVCFLIQADFAFAEGLDKYLKNLRMNIRKVKFIPVNLRTLPIISSSTPMK